jgi:hypothetical protein
MKTVKSLRFREYFFMGLYCGSNYDAVRARDYVNVALTEELDAVVA